MQKRVASVITAVCLLCCCLTPAAAAEPVGEMRVRLHSDVAGRTRDDIADHIEILSDNLIIEPVRKWPVSVYDYAGTPEFGRLKAGRIYYIYYDLVPAEGYVLPDNVADADLKIECGKGVSVYSVQIVKKAAREDTGAGGSDKGLMIYAAVTVDGSFFQRVVGRLYDIYLKIKAWSLY